MTPRTHDRILNALVVVIVGAGLWAAPGAHPPASGAPAGPSTPPTLPLTSPPPESGNVKLALPANEANRLPKAVEAAISDANAEIVMSADAYDVAKKKGLVAEDSTVSLQATGAREALGIAKDPLVRNDATIVVELPAEVAERYKERIGDYLVVAPSPVTDGLVQALKKKLTDCESAREQCNEDLVACRKE